MVLDIIVSILGISFLVVVHEGGHYLAARAASMRVTRFSIGFGPALVRYQPKGSPTVFQICAIPLLAYVAISGMNPAEDVDPEDPELYPNKGLFARFATIFAGPFANYLAASVMIFFLAVLSWPAAVPAEPMEIDSVTPSSPADKAGLKPGDIVVEANGEKIRNVNDLIKVTKPRAGKPTEYVIEHKGARKRLTITPELQHNRGIIGVTAKFTTQYTSLPFTDALIKAVVLPIDISIANLIGIATLIEQRSTEGISGPVGIAKIAVAHAERGFADFVQILILISVVLGMFNLLPLPALDGGRLVFLGFELITRRKPNEKMEAVVHAIGLLFFIGLLILVTLRDIGG